MTVMTLQDAAQVQIREASVSRALRLGARSEPQHCRRAQAVLCSTFFPHMENKTKKGQAKTTCWQVLVEASWRPSLVGWRPSLLGPGGGMIVLQVSSQPEMSSSFHHAPFRAASFRSRASFRARRGGRGWLEELRPVPAGSDVWIIRDSQPGRPARAKSSSGWLP